MSVYKVARVVKEFYEVTADSEEDLRKILEKELPQDDTRFQVGDFEITFLKETPPFCWSFDEHIREDGGSFYFSEDLRSNYDCETNTQVVSLVSNNGLKAFNECLDSETSCFFANFESDTQARQFIDAMNDFHQKFKAGELV